MCTVILIVKEHFLCVYDELMRMFFCQIKQDFSADFVKSYKAVLKLYGGFLIGMPATHSQRTTCARDAHTKSLN